jgi:hypothetical protein
MIQENGGSIVASPILPPDINITSTAADICNNILNTNNAPDISASSCIIIVGNKL